MEMELVEGQQAGTKGLLAGFDGMKGFVVGWMEFAMLPLIMSCSPGPNPQSGLPAMVPYERSKH